MKKINLLIGILSIIWACSSGNEQNENIHAQSTIASTSDYGIAVAEDGTVWQWEYQNGKPGPANPVEGLDNIAAVKLSQKNALALRNNGDLFSWNLGNVATLEKDEKTKYLKIATYNRSLGALTEDGKAGTNVYPSANQVLSKTEETVIDFSICNQYILVVKNDGSVWGMGNNGNKRYHADKEFTSSLGLIEGLENIVQVESFYRMGYYVNFALAENGSLYFWGEETSGKIKKVEGYEDFVDIIDNTWKRADGTIGGYEYKEIKIPIESSSGANLSKWSRVYIPKEFEKDKMYFKDNFQNKDFWFLVDSEGTVKIDFNSQYNSSKGAVHTTGKYRYTVQKADGTALIVKEPYG